ncbi:Uncharacterised protein [Mycobacterium tuberculosis]|nr:Uncharacterised protein [Mycobacterium tuberculosis]
MATGRVMSNEGNGVTVTPGASAATTCRTIDPSATAGTTNRSAT